VTAGDRRLRVVVADDHVVVRKGIIRLLEASGRIEVVGEAGSVREAITETWEREPDAVLLDVHMPDGSSLAAIPELVRRHPPVKIVVLSMDSHAADVRAAMEAGAHGFVPKVSADVEVVRALEAVVEGETFVASEAAVALVTEPDPRADEPPIAPIDVRILRLVAQGMTNREVGQALNLHPRNVERRRLDAMKVLGLHARSELVAYALKHGWLGEGEG
jgi:two-component system response regulator NreC